MQRRFGWGRVARLASLCVLAGALFAACADEESEEPSGAAVTATATATAKAASTAERGKYVRGGLINPVCPDHAGQAR